MDNTSSEAHLNHLVYWYAYLKKNEKCVPRTACTGICTRALLASHRYWYYGTSAKCHRVPVHF